MSAEGGEHRPDLNLMDLQMPEMNCLDAIIAIHNEFSEARIIVLTSYKGDVQVLRAHKACARAYLLKGLLRKELLGSLDNRWQRILGQSHSPCPILDDRR